MQQILKNIWTWFLSLVQKKYQTCRVGEELPQQLKSKIIYLVGDQNALWQASFICPCGCNEIIHLNLLPDDSPCWRVIFTGKDKISLHPSVWRKVGCESHFWIEAGQTIWVN